MPKEYIKRKVTRKELDSALFIDFEGYATKIGGKPDFSNPDIRKFVGVLWMTNRLKLRQFIMDPDLKLCAKTFNAAESGLCDEHRVQWFTTREKTESKLVEFLLNFEGLIISWSEHDWNVMEKMMDNDYFSNDDRENIKSRWRNALQTARPWNTVTLHRKIPDGKLSSYRDEIGYEGEPEQKKMSQNLKDLTQRLEKKRNPEELTETQLEMWRLICVHNFHDLEGMRQVLLHAVAKD